MKHILTALILTALCHSLPAQQIAGKVHGTDATGNVAALPGASVYWEGTAQGVTTDIAGQFAIDPPHEGSRRLIASFTGFASDTAEVAADARQVTFLLSEGVMLKAATVTARRRGSYISRITPLQTELITETGLQKMACCNLAESFENSATVTVGYTDAVSGARQIQMLGLSGIYTQMLDENIPTMRGLAAPFGWNCVPGPWLESIQVSKGAASVVNGYESTTGQINMEFKKPDATERLFVNLFGAGDGRMEASIVAAAPVVQGNLWTGVMMHGSAERMEHDANGDSFMDMPKTRQLNLYNRWLYRDETGKLESRTGVRLLGDRRQGGQIAGAGSYRTGTENRSISIFNKTGFLFGRRPNQSIGIIGSLTHHEIESASGAKAYGGRQNTAYGNILLSSYLGSKAHSYTVGVSALHDQFSEYYRDTLAPIFAVFSRDETVAGAFAQYTWASGGPFTLIAGLRGDWHSRFGMLLTPRAGIKYDITPGIILRASAGRGYRSPSVISENIGLLASSRRFNLASIPTLDIERAWNGGASLTVYIPMPRSRTTTIAVDWYHTRFSSQAIADMEYSRHEVYFYNLVGKSHASAWQAELHTTPVEGLDLTAAFRASDTRITYTHGTQSRTAAKPLVNKYRGLLNISWATRFEKWKFDATAQLNGPARLPALADRGYPDIETHSPAYPLYFFQITRKTKHFDFYAGCENILNYRQKDPVIAPDDPFGPFFDASRVWGPLMGRKIYAGIRFKLEIY